MVKGAYLLIIHLSKSKKIKIGKLGYIFFKKGNYIYVGSALNNLEKRIQRHKSKRKKLRWHIDYFLRFGRISGVSAIKTNKKIECKLSEKILKIAEASVKNFGCSDCRCNSHLYYFDKNPLKAREFNNIFKTMLI